MNIGIRDFWDNEELGISIGLLCTNLAVIEIHDRESVENNVLFEIILCKSFIIVDGSMSIFRIKLDKISI